MSERRFFLKLLKSGDRLKLVPSPANSIILIRIYKIELEKDIYKVSECYCRGYIVENLLGIITIS